MDPTIRDVDVRDALDPDCRRCPRGAGLALTVYFHGAGERGFLSSIVEYTEEEEEFPGQLAERLGRGPHECCRRELAVVEHSPRRRIAENAEKVAKKLRDRLEDKAEACDWLTRVSLHLVGYSSGGLIALETARQLDTSAVLHPPGTRWCGHEVDLEVSIEMDLVTVATPLALEFPGAGTISTDRPWTFEHSVGASEYQAPPASKLCSFATFVSSKRHGDDSFGADRDPGDDTRLSGLLSDISPTKKRIVELKDHWQPADPDDEDDPDHVSHVEVPEKVLEHFAWALVPGCRCVQTL